MVRVRFLKETINPPQIRRKPSTILLLQNPRSETTSNLNSDQQTLDSKEGQLRILALIPIYHDNFNNGMKTIVPKAVPYIYINVHNLQLHEYPLGRVQREDV